MTSGCVGIQVAAQLAAMEEMGGALGALREGRDAAQAAAAIQEAGVILRALPGDIVGFCPPLVITESELDDMFDRIDTAMDHFATTADAHR